MEAVFTDEQVALADAAQGLAASGLKAARLLLEGGELPTSPTADLFEGFNGLGIDESLGGIGGSLVDLAIVARELGRTVCPSPWLTHQLALQAGAAAGLDVTDGLSTGARWALVAGPPSAVRDGVGATMAVVVDGDRVSLAPVSSATPRKALDPTRPMADLELGAPVAEAATGGVQGLQRARAIVAASLTGTGLGAVERAAAYANGREQFGKPVAIFQGVSHSLAEAWTHVELAWSLALYAAWAIGESRADAGEAVAAAVAKAGSAAVDAAERGMQVHGGIGITWEADPHLALRRAMADDAWLGSSRDAELELGRLLLSR